MRKCNSFCDAIYSLDENCTWMKLMSKILDWNLSCSVLSKYHNGDFKQDLSPWIFGLLFKETILRTSNFVMHTFTILRYQEILKLVVLEEMPLPFELLCVPTI